MFRLLLIGFLTLVPLAQSASVTHYELGAALSTSAELYINETARIRDNLEEEVYNATDIMLSETGQEESYVIIFLDGYVVDNIIRSEELCLRCVEDSYLHIPEFTLGQFVDIDTTLIAICRPELEDFMIFKTIWRKDYCMAGIIDIVAELQFQRQNARIPDHQ